MSPEEFGDLFARFEHSALRLESRDEYGGEADRAAIANWQPGRRARPHYSVRTSPWAAQLATTSIAGKRWQRVRLVTFPLNAYIQWELATYAESSVLGEEIRILASTPEFVELQDAWIFDRETGSPTVVVMRYDEAGEPLEHELITDSERAQAVIQGAEQAWAGAISLDQFIAADAQLRYSA